MLHVLVFAKTRTCNVHFKSQNANKYSWPHRECVACPGLPEDQDMQPHLSLAKHASPPILDDISSHVSYWYNTRMTLLRHSFTTSTCGHRDCFVHQHIGNSMPPPHIRHTNANAPASAGIARRSPNISTTLYTTHPTIHRAYHHDNPACNIQNIGNTNSHDMMARYAAPPLACEHLRCMFSNRVT